MRLLSMGVSVTGRREADIVAEDVSKKIENAVNPEPLGGVF
jgi:hypothetical protein